MKRCVLPLIAVLVLCAAHHAGAQPRQEKAVALQSFNYLNLYVGHENGRGRMIDINSDESRKQATFYLVAGLAENEGVSFRSLSAPNAYLRHQEGRVKLQPLVDAVSFRKDATFKMIQGLTDASWKSFESVSQPGCFLRHKKGKPWVERNDGTPQFAADATFRLVAPPAPPPVQTPESIAQKGFSLAGARYQDIAQGKAGTCWILSSMAALQHHGIDLTKRIRYEGNNRYLVTLSSYNKPASRPNGGMHTQVVRVHFDGNTTKADPVFDPKNPRSAWVVIMQRAVIQAVHRWDPNQVVDNPRGGWGGDALAILTGRAARHVEIRNGHAAQAMNAVKAALAARKTVVFASTDTAKTLVPNHDYAVVGHSSHGLTLYNPWGSRLNVPWNVISREGQCFFIE